MELKGNGDQGFVTEMTSLDELRSFGFPNPRSKKGSFKAVYSSNNFDYNDKLMDTKMFWTSAENPCESSLSMSRLPLYLTTWCLSFDVLEDIVQSFCAAQTTVRIPVPTANPACITSKSISRN